MAVRYNSCFKGSCSFAKGLKGIFMLPGHILFIVLSFLIFSTAIFLYFRLGPEPKEEKK